jgi:peptidoglycan hydrolase-like protein with peptidoglycan-binding domain
MLFLGACSTTVVSGASDLPVDAELEASLAALVDPTVVDSPNGPVTDTTVDTTAVDTTAVGVDEPDPDTAGPSTTAPPVATTAPTTTAPTTTSVVSTTLPDRRIAVEPMDPPLNAMGSSSGAETARLQERLLDLGFWVQSVDGTYGLTTRQAVMAFQKYHGLRATGSVDGETAFWLSGMDEKARGRADAGTLLEVDKSRQIIFFVIDGTTEWVLNTSTGTEVPYERPNSNNPEIIERGSSVTPNGLHFVNRQRPEGWWEGDLGKIYRPKYFVGGVAVHGAPSIPNYPASHGCVRVSVPAMDWIWDSGILPMDTPVWVHGSIPSGSL